VQLRSVFRKFDLSKKDSKAADALGIIGSIFEQLAEGQSMEFPEETLRGVEHFCRGELAEALTAYEEAFAETGFPFSSLIPPVGGQLSGLMLRLTQGVVVEKDDLPKRAEEAGDFTRSHEVFALLVRRFSPEKIPDGVAKAGATSMAGMVLQMEKTRAQLKGGDASVIESIDQRKKALMNDATAFTRNPDSVLPLVPLPSVHRALYEGQQSSR
jgi:hypothetical protein